MNKITGAFLRAQVDRLNRATKSPLLPYVGNVAQIGNYHISGACGGVSLHRMHSAGGGISDVFRCGHINKRDLSSRISALMVGLET